MSFPSELFQGIRVLNLLDITLFALFLYVFILWLRQGTSSNVAGRAAVVAVVFAALYFLARSLDLFLVERLLQFLLIAYLLITVVVFQADVRRLLNRAAPWRFLSSSTPTTDASLTDLLTEAAKHLAETRTGALIALKGQERWDDYTQGGVALEGLVSQPLLYSLFSPDTPGHDGAILIEGGRITKFAVHLPLATRLPEASRYGGTRHVAALGLAEHCDAMVVVVSEESGTISVAQEGTLNEVASAAELKQRLERFVQPGAQARRGGLSWGRWLNLPVALLSISLAVLLWLFLAYSPNKVYRNLEVPVEFHNLPPGWELSSSNVNAVQVTLAGPEQAFEFFDPEGLVLSLDLINAQAGENTFIIDSDQLDLPSWVRLHSADPLQVRVELSPLRPVEVPVEVQTVGFLPASLSLEEVSVEPQTVLLLVPQAESQQLSRVLTEPINLRDISVSSTIPTTLQVPAGWQLPEGVSPEVSVRVEVRPR